MREEIDYAEALQRFKDNPHIFIVPWGRQVDHLNVTIKARAGTLYDGRQFLFEIKYPSNYPQQPPFVFCHTLVPHPKIVKNVAPVKEGATNVCLYLLAPQFFPNPEQVQEEKGWTPNNTLADVIVALYAICSLKSPQSPPSPPPPRVDPPFEVRKLWFE